MKRFVFFFISLLFCLNSFALCENCVKWVGDGIKEDKYYKLSAGSNPFNECGSCNYNGHWQSGGCPGAKPCCNTWTIKSVEKIEGFTYYYNYVCDEWHVHQDYLPYSGGRDECLEYKIVKFGDKYTNECIKWKYYDGDLRMIYKIKDSDESMDTKYYRENKYKFGYPVN